MSDNRLKHNQSDRSQNDTNVCKLKLKNTKQEPGSSHETYTNIESHNFVNFCNQNCSKVQKENSLQDSNSLPKTGKFYFVIKYVLTFNHS